MSSHANSLRESMKIKAQKEDEKKVKASEKEEKDKIDALAFHVLKVSTLEDYNKCSPEEKANFALGRLGNVNVPELVKIHKAFTGNGRGDLNSRELLLKAIMAQIHK